MRLKTYQQKWPKFKRGGGTRILKMNRTLFACATILNGLAYIQLDAQERRRLNGSEKKNLNDSGQKSLKFGEKNQITTT